MSSPESLRDNRANAIPAELTQGIIDDGVERLRGALRIMRSDTKGRQSRFIHSLAKSFIQKLLFKGLIHLVTLARDAFDRQAPTDHLRALSREWDAMIDQWELERDGFREVACIQEVHGAEEHSEGIQEESEVQLAYDPSPRTASNFIVAAARHIESIKRMMRVAYRIRDGHARMRA